MGLPGWGKERPRGGALRGRNAAHLLNLTLLDGRVGGGKPVSPGRGPGAGGCRDVRRCALRCAAEALDGCKWSRCPEQRGGAVFVGAGWSASAVGFGGGVGLVGGGVGVVLGHGGVPF